MTAENKSIFRALANPRMAIVLAFGFVAGIPLALTAATLQAWMVDEKVDLTTIGILSLVGLPYTIKFLWAPVFDRYIPPFLGRRRGWLLITQALVALSIAAMAFSSPGTSPGVVAILAIIVAFCSASHDTVNDAFRTEMLDPSEYGLGSSLYVMGYRIAMLVSGGGALILSDHMSWRAVYLVMASTMLIGVVTTLLSPESNVAPKPITSLKDAMVLPLKEFFKRTGAVEILIFLIIYKLDTNLTVAMTTPFMMSVGFTKTEIGAVIKGFGTFATIGGTLIGGSLMVHLGLKRSLWIFGIAQMLAGLSYAVLAKVGHSYPMMVTAITLENVCSGMGIAAQAAFMMSVVDKRFTATQYSLLASFMGLSRYVASAPSGWMAENLAWSNYFIVCTLVGLPGLFLLTRYNRWSLPSAKA